MEKDIYVCTECSTPEKCISVVYDSITAPSECLYNNYREADPPSWQKTTDYEIVRKPEPRLAEPKVRRFPNKKEMDDFIKENLEPVFTTPNCSICEWIMYENRPDDTVPDNFSYEHGVCKAQGNKDADECYNSPECKRLFSARDLPACATATEDK